MKVRIARSAEADLEAIGDWIAERNPGRALTFVDELRDRCLSLSRRPNRFPSIGHVAGHSLRKVSHRGYLIFNIVNLDRVDIERVAHGARDWAALIGDLE